MINYDDTISDISEINKHIGKTIYLLIVDDLIFGSTRKTDINRYLEDDSSLVGIDDYDEDDTTLLYGLVLDPQKLPYELPLELKLNDVWMLRKHSEAALIGMVELFRNIDIEEAVNSIEEAIDSDSALSIEDFAIIVGRELNFVLQIGPKQFEVDAKYLSV